MKVYIAGSLSNGNIPKLTAVLKKEGYEAFSEWFTPGPDADVNWRNYEQSIGNDYRTSLKLPSAQNTYKFDKKHIDNSDVMILTLPSGRSAHLEAGYFIGKGRPVIILMQGEPERWDVMYNFAYENSGYIAYNEQELLAYLKRVKI